MFQRIKSLALSFVEGIPRFLKYQIVTKLLFSALIIPLFWTLTQFLMNSRGLSAVSNSEMLKFLMTPEGFVFLLFAILLIVLGLILELCGFITISAQVIHKREESSYWELFKANLKLAPKMFEFGMVILCMYLIVLAPLTQMGVTLSIFKEIQIPNFISSVIENTPLYLGIYWIVLTIMLVLSFQWLFTFQFMTLGKMNPTRGMKASSRMVRKQWKKILKDLTVVNIGIGLSSLLLSFVWALIIVALSEFLDLTHDSSRILMMVLLLLQKVGLAVVTLLVIPFEVHYVTVLFYECLERDPAHLPYKIQEMIIPAKTRKSLLDRILSKKRALVVLTMVIAILLAVPMGIFFKELFQPTSKVAIIAHRGGGNAAPENSLSGIKHSIKNDADWVEIDVQRTKDGFYILNHDETFKRIANDARTPQEMTLKEIEQLDIGEYFSNEFKGEHVPRLEAVLKFCKGKIGVNIELKGKSADSKMVEDVIKIVEKEGMRQDVILTSLDADLIQRIENKYPQFKTGFIYFLSFGNMAEFKADYLILEEGEVSEKNLDAIHQAGKKVVVWTVNTPEAMAKYVKMDIDGIITDEVETLKNEILKRDLKTEQELLLENFFGESGK